MKLLDRLSLRLPMPTPKARRGRRRPGGQGSFCRVREGKSRHQDQGGSAERQAVECDALLTLAAVTVAGFGQRRVATKALLEHAGTANPTAGHNASATFPGGTEGSQTRWWREHPP
jgi:hypothetical protein